MDAGYRGRAAPCQRERSDRASDRVTAVGTFHRGDVPDSHRPPPFGLLAEAVPRQPRAGNRPVSEARPALWTDSRETSGYVVETDCGRPPQSNQPLRADKPSTAPWVFRADLHSLPAPSWVLAPPCFTVRQGMGAFTRDLFLISEAVQPPSRPAYASGGAGLPLNRRGHVIERLLGLDAIAPSPGCGSPEGGRYCRLGAHRRPMPGGRLVRMDCSSACRSLTLFELRATFLYGHRARADVERPM